MLGFDAAEHSLVSAMIRRGKLPVLAGLMQRGCTGLLNSPASLYPGAVWPSFYTGRKLPWHGIYHGKQWNANRMCCMVPNNLAGGARPFWELLNGTGIRSCIMDMPLLLGKARPIDGSFISGWATHDPMSAGSAPSSLWREIEREVGSPQMPVENFGPQTVATMQPLCAELLRATEQAQRVMKSLLRRDAWDFACMIFGTAHRAGHYLWDLSELQDPERLEPAQREELESALERVYESVDHSLGEVLADIGSDVVVIIFAAHGMGPNPGWSDFLPAMLDARRAALSQSVARKGLLYSLRQRYATNLLRPLVRAMPPAITAALLPLWSARMFDWKRTPFFPIPMDLSGYVRVNLKGRERDGIVEPGGPYEQICSELEAFFGSLRDSATDAPIVAQTLRAYATTSPDAPHRDGLPDLIVQWGDLPTRGITAVKADGLPGFDYRVPQRLPSGRSGNHRSLGWFVAAGPGVPAGTRLPVQDILDLAPTALHPGQRSRRLCTARACRLKRRNVILDARRDTPGDCCCDVCIVGAGVAGLTLAIELAASQLSVCVLEAGGLKRGEVPQSMLAGEVADGGYPTLHTVRVAGVGGSTNVWAGWCRPLDAIDFEQRAAVPHSGWPFGPEELTPYYARAHAKLDLGPFEYDAACWENVSGAQRLPLPATEIAAVLFRQCKLNIGASHSAAVARSPRVRLLLNANVMRLRFSANGTAVTSVEAATLNGKTFVVHPRVVVVAAGGIESARLLLLSAEASGGCGNENGLVGRYFTEHGYDDSAVFLPADSGRSLKFYFPLTAGGTDAAETVRGAFALSAARLRRDGLLNSVMFFRPAHEAHPVFQNPRVQAALELWDMLRSRAVPDRRLAQACYAAGAPHAILHALWRRYRDRGEMPTRLRVRTLFECAPDPDNRITLGRVRDRLGRPVAKVHWRMRDLDLVSVSRAHELLDAALRSTRLGHLRLQGGGGAGRPPPTPGKHHLGTTRMHRDPARGVVDANSKVHGKDNLFVTGGSVFTTGGFANPTLTVVALTLRLAAHLERIVPRLDHPIQ
jgi:choline dehydrogenase-like flavoprotein/predicted AlkP superfamily phosphohydrolase/phosphomutase